MFLSQMNQKTLHLTLFFVGVALGVFPDDVTVSETICGVSEAIEACTCADSHTPPGDDCEDAYNRGCERFRLKCSNKEDCCYVNRDWDEIQKSESFQNIYI